jgi:hypothetical protein
VHLEKCTSMYIDLFPIIFIVLSSNYSTVLYVAIQLQLANTSSGSRQYSKIVINVLCFAVNILHDYLSLFIYIIYILCLFFFVCFVAFISFVYIHFIVLVHELFYHLLLQLDILHYIFFPLH